eukprot:g64457.t1
MGAEPSKEASAANEAHAPPSPHKKGDNENEHRSAADGEGPGKANLLASIQAEVILEAKKREQARAKAVREKEKAPGGLERPKLRRQVSAERAAMPAGPAALIKQISEKLDEEGLDMPEPLLINLVRQVSQEALKKERKEHPAGPPAAPPPAGPALPVAPPAEDVVSLSLAALAEGSEKAKEEQEAMQQARLELARKQSSKSSKETSSQGAECGICGCEAGAEPTSKLLELKCSHCYCVECLQQQLKAKWPGARLTFSFLLCGFCRAPLADTDKCKFPAEVAQEIKTSQDLEKAVGVVALKKLKVDDPDLKDLRKALQRVLDKEKDKEQGKEAKSERSAAEWRKLLGKLSKSLDDSAPVKEGKEGKEGKAAAKPGEPFKIPDEVLTEHAMRIMACFMCTRCKLPFVGGRVECGAAGDQAAEPDPTTLVCHTCTWSGLSSDHKCNTHGISEAMYKCDSCCNIATYSCSNNSKYCDRCHPCPQVNQVKDFPCPGPDKCPLGMPHPPNLGAPYGQYTAPMYIIGCIACMTEESTKAASPTPS